MAAPTSSLLLGSHMLLLALKILHSLHPKYPKMHSPRLSCLSLKIHKETLPVGTCFILNKVGMDSCGDF